ncbi:MAG: alpha-amylase family glycosyl hydrolase [Aggregatilineales bacterium]
MSQKLVIHYDNANGFQEPTLFVQHGAGKDLEKISAHSKDDFGTIFEVATQKDKSLTLKFYDAQTETTQDTDVYHHVSAQHFANVKEIWCRSWHVFVYTSRPQSAQPKNAGEIVAEYTFTDGTFISDTSGRFALGASKLQGDGVLFGIFHPHAARIYVTGDFNDWQHPDCENPDESKFMEMDLVTGYFDMPNVWLLKVDSSLVGQGYKFYVVYDTLAGDGTLDNRLMVDPYARFLGMDYERNDSIIVDPSAYTWNDADYHTHTMQELIIYELHVHGFTQNHPDIVPEHQGKYQGIVDRIESGYFDKLGITTLYLMPISEVPTPQGEEALGYNSSLFMAIERDFGTPDELRHLVDTAHQHNLAVIIDQVFNHSANSWNPLWQFILDHPDEAMQGEEGGLYFSGKSPWGNRMATERTETQNMLIDACKMMIVDYHIDGFRFDATHTFYMDHGFLHRLAGELQALKPNVILIAENLPNEADLNREGYNGFAQWCDPFHDAIKALLREGKFEGTDDHPENLGDMFYFSKGKFAAHTNNAVNYCESHDEHSVAHEISFVEALNHPSAKDRKSRLGIFATIIALGQPMIYMGQEFGTERERNRVYFDFPENLDEHGFFQWASRLISLRRRYSALKLHGYNPIEEGQFTWLLGAWLDDRHGKGKRVLGWRATPSNDPEDHMVILINLENHDVEVDIPFGTPGTWVRLATINLVNDIAPDGTNTTEEETALHLPGGTISNFVLQDSAAYIYKWQPKA